MSVYILGYPAVYGGANVELFASARLWCSRGMNTFVVPRWGTTARWEKRLREIGCKTFEPGTAWFRNERNHLPDGSIVVSFSNPQLYELWNRLRNCHLISVPCMSKPGGKDKEFHASGRKFDRYVFQSRYQLQQWSGTISDVLLEHRRLIPGIFFPDEYPYQPLPHESGTPFQVGRISRPDKAKFSKRLWKAYTPIPNVHVTIMGWSPEIGHHCGTLRTPASLLRKNEVASQDFYRGLHALVQPGGTAMENWPRFVLEAMSSGVPVVTNRSGGIPEMIVDGETGFLCDSEEEMAEAATRLALDEPLRLKIARQAYDSLARIANTDLTWNKWDILFQEVEYE